MSTVRGDAPGGVAAGCGRGRRDPFPPSARRTLRARMEPRRVGNANACRVVLSTPAAPGCHAARRAATRTPTSVLAETPIDHVLSGRPVVRPEHAPIHDGLGGRVEHLVLELSSTELGADEVPDELHQLD